MPEVTPTKIKDEGTAGATVVTVTWMGSGGTEESADDSTSEHIRLVASKIKEYWAAGKSPTVKAEHNGSGVLTSLSYEFAPPSS